MYLLKYIYNISNLAGKNKLVDYTEVSMSVERRLQATARRGVSPDRAFEIWDYEAYFDRSAPHPDSKEGRMRTIIKRFKEGKYSYGSLFNFQMDALSVVWSRTGVLSFN
jgi:hypothetical protein